MITVLVAFQVCTKTPRRGHQHATDTRDPLHTRRFYPARRRGAHPISRLKMMMAASKCCLCTSRTLQDLGYDCMEEWSSLCAAPLPMMTPHTQVMAILERIKRQDAGEIEPPAIAFSGKMGANPASEDFVEQSAAASRQQAAGGADGDEDGNAIDLPNEVGSLSFGLLRLQPREDPVADTLRA